MKQANDTPHASSEVDDRTCRRQVWLEASQCRPFFLVALPVIVVLHLAHLAELVLVRTRTCNTSWACSVSIQHSVDANRNPYLRVQVHGLQLAAASWRKSQTRKGQKLKRQGWGVLRTGSQSTRPQQNRATKTLSGQRKGESPCV